MTDVAPRRSVLGRATHQSESAPDTHLAELTPQSQMTRPRQEHPQDLHRRWIDLSLMRAP
jgi:hypothetical protein